MNFKIGEKIPRDSYNGYILKINTMQGDADGYNSVEVRPGNNVFILEDILLTCKRMEKKYPCGRGGGDDYNEVEGFEKWFSEESTLKEGTKEYSVAPFEWPSDSYGHQDSIDGWDLTYQQDGELYKVEVK